MITIDTKGTTNHFNYNIGDKILVQPNNSPSIVERCAKVFNMKDLDSKIELTSLDLSLQSTFPKATTPRKLLTSFLDIQSIPSRFFLEQLSLIAKDVNEKTELEFLSTNMLIGNEYTRRAQTECFSIVDVLEKYKSAQLKFEQFISLCPNIFPRYYSICSSPLVSADTLQIVYADDRKVDKNGKLFEGLCTKYMSNLKQGDVLVINHPISTMKADNHEDPILLVGLGTGLGVIRGILQQRQMYKKKGKNIGKALLFVGVRHENKDFLFKDEFKELEKEGLVEIIPAFSMDQEKFISVIDKMEEFPNKVYDTLRNGGQYFYCGLGGLIPGQIEQAIIHAISSSAGISSVAANQAIKYLKSQEKWNVEGFSTNIDEENLFKDTKIRKQGKSETSSLSVYDQFSGSAKMFCFQCEQTDHAKGCTTVGICGKTPDVAALQDLLIEYCKRLSWYGHNLRKMGVKYNQFDRLSLAAMFATLTNVNFDGKRIAMYINEVRKGISILEERYLEECKKNGVKPEDTCPKEDSELVKTKGDFDVENPEVLKNLVKVGEDYGVLKRYFAVRNDSVVGLQEMLVYGLKGLCAYADHSLMFLMENEEIYSFIYEALAFLTTKDAEDIGKVLGMLMKCGTTNYSAMKLLHEANTTFGAQTPHEVATTPVLGKCILVSGHDMKMLGELLKQTENQDINIYTHGEMLPAHGYPGLRKYKHLKGHLGGAWQKQSIEFPKIPGSILMTTNCLTHPRPEYEDRIFTAGVVGWPGTAHLPLNAEDCKKIIFYFLFLNFFFIFY